MSFKFKTLTAAALMSLGLSVNAGYGYTVDPNMTEEQLNRTIKQAEYHVKEFEKEVELQHGGDKTRYINKQNALDRVQALKLAYPDNPEIEKLFQRTKTALMKSKGDYATVDPAWLKYRVDEENLRKKISALGDEEWNRILASSVDPAKIVAKEFPAPDPKKVSIEELKGSFVVLTDVEYPNNQFYGGTGEYIWHGKPSSGYYFVLLDGRHWIGPYEAVKRYRRLVDSSLADVTKFTILGKITDITAEIPAAGEEKNGRYEMGWVVEPVAVKVPDHVVAVYDEKADSSGRFIGEEQVAQIKDSWYTVKSIPADVKPERLMEIFMTAIKEKNYDLYLDCIDPERKKTPTALSLIKYHWDLHQERFLREYVHAVMDKAKIYTTKGFDEGNEQENFFLDDDQKDILRKTQGEQVQRAEVESRAYDQNGKQLGSPHPHFLIKRGAGRWYVSDYAARF
ncbi:MAG: hypothetical protein K5752_06600 [Succinivibrionaceae bacterium]|nr:hypothetical protein [Succinivibrionaceae bacterium]